MQKHCILVGAPVDSGQRTPGCLMGPSAYRVAGLPAIMKDLGHEVEDWGDAAPQPGQGNAAVNPAVHAQPETVAWTQGLAQISQRAMGAGFPIFMGGDHSMSLGTVAGVAAYAKAQGRPLYILWLDAHSDFHTPLSTDSGHFHGMPVAYIAGLKGFEAFPAFPAPVPPQRICLFGIRSVDQAEHDALQRLDLAVNDMRVLDERGIVAPLREFLHTVAKDNGLLHVSLDVDFLDPTIAPGVGTTVPGGATFREAHLVMELLHEHDLVTSLDLAELNPFLDERGRTARLMVDLVASLMGRKVFDRPTMRYS
ncbi:MAG TPA: arginase [Alphaproteobacteria bacterium]|nr:arginase [Alphaproteobacteria bacterium]HAJ45762.1 arginase [Alphaproteobacteria bacterium]